jgi:RNA polymerase sigma-70 factor (ECF subfamily)
MSSMAAEACSPMQSNDDASKRDAELLRSLRRRDLAALDALLAAHGARLSRLAYLLVGDRHSAADIVQETLIAAWDSARRTDERTRLRSWLSGILLNRCRKHRRSAGRRRRRESEAVQRRAAEMSAGAAADSEDLAAMQRALLQLDDDLREVLVLRYFQQLGVREAADAIGVPEGTVKSRSHAAIAAMRALMQVKP